MSTEVNLKLKILDVKSLTSFVTKEINSKEAKDFEELEEIMQKEYTGSIITRAELEVGSYVAVKSYLGHARKSPKKWFRAVIHNVFMSVGTYLYDVYLLDYDLNRVVKRTEVRELNPQFKDDYKVPYQILNFHLTGIKLKNGVNNSEEGKMMVKELLAKNDNIVLAKIMSQTNTNRLGLIYLNDGSELRKYYIDKGWVQSIEDYEFITNSDVRKPKTSPIFKCVNNSIIKNRESQENRSFSDKNSVASDSLSSVSSVDLSLESDQTQTISDEEEFTLNFISKQNGMKKTDKSENAINGSINETNGLPKSRREKLNSLFTRIKLKDQNGESVSNEKYGQSSKAFKDKCKSDIEYVTYHESKSQTEVDWPLEAVKDDRYVCNARPAGLQPPSEVVERIFTMKTQRKVPTEMEFW